MGLLLDIYKSAAMGGGCSNGGISASHDEVCVVNAHGPFDPSDKAPPVLLESHVKGCVRAVPAVQGPDGKWKCAPGQWANGGTFVATSDSRFRAIVEGKLGHQFYGAVALHDYKVT